MKNEKLKTVNFATELEETRQKLGVSAEQLAALLHIKIDTYRALQSGSKLPTDAQKIIARRLKKVVTSWKL